MVIILEGNECAGKTTEARRIVAGTGGRIQHFPAPQNDDEAFGYWKVYADALSKVRLDETVVFDRSWISDMVYGPVMRNRSEMQPEMAAMLNQIAASKGGFIVYCYAPLKVIQQRYKQRGDDYIKDIKLLKELQQKYDEVISQQRGIPIYRYITG